MNEPPRKADDPLGRDTSDPDWIKKMAREALEGRNDEAVEGEMARIEKFLGLPPMKNSRRQRLRRWLSRRWWKFRFKLKDRMMNQLRPGETDAQYLARLAAGGPLRGRGAIEIMMTEPTSVGDIQRTFIRVLPDGVVDTIAGGKRLVFRLDPPPFRGETAFQLIERVATACRKIAEF